MDEAHEDFDVDERLESLYEKAFEFYNDDLERSAFRVFGELRQAAKRDQRVCMYINTLFFYMICAEELFDLQTARETAIALLALLENEEQARLIEPDFDAEEYEYTAGWMTTCVYEKLADQTGMMEGFNSQGMQNCIADGLQVCRRTGKLACTQCFREYAADVYRAADDLDMSLHHCESIIAHQGQWSDRGNRRWYAAKSKSWLHVLRGEFDVAQQLIEQAVELNQEEDVNLPDTGLREIAPEFESVMLLTGHKDPAIDGPNTRDYPARPPGDEKPKLDLRWGLHDALAACCREEWDEAARMLVQWDRRLTEQNSINEWFEVRLRLIAALRLSGREQRVEALAGQLESRAKQACDWLTLRRLDRLVSDGRPDSPLALLAPPHTGLFAKSQNAQPVSTTETETPSDQAVDQQQDDDEITPMRATFEAWLSRIGESGGDESVRAAVIDEMLNVSPESVTHWKDAGQFIHVMRFLLIDAERGREIWPWAQRFAAPFRDNASVLNVLAALGHTLRILDESLAEAISGERIEKLFRKSLELDADKPKNFDRAGDYYLSVDNYGDAERCYARGFRLDRANGDLALSLAEVYRYTDRTRDALAVLDMCLREGCEEPGVAWEASMTSLTAEQYDSLLTYITKFEEIQPGETWSNYYRATALVELDRPQEALDALDEEQRRNPDQTFHLEALRTCATASLKDFNRSKQHLDNVLAQRLSEVDYLTLTGLARLFERFWQAVEQFPPEMPVRKAVAKRLLMAGLAPDDVFEEYRQKGEVYEDVHFYQVTVSQPLDENWANSHACLAGQQSWPAYQIQWGVIARDEDEAKQHVLKWQRHCYPLTASVEEIESDGESYTDAPGVVWQGLRWYDGPDDEAEADDL